METKKYEIPQEIMDEFLKDGWVYIGEEDNSVFIFECNDIQLGIIHKYKEYFIEPKFKGLGVCMTLKTHVTLNKLFKYWGWI